MYDKQEAIEDAQQYVGLQNKFNITDFTPVDKTKVEKMTPPSKIKRRNTRVQFGEDQDLEDSDDSE